MKLLLLLAIICISTTATPDALKKLRHLPRVKRVIGGSSAILGQWPWLAHLKGKIPSSYFWGITTGYKNYYCGGAVINRRWIMTAAHCFNVPGAPTKIKTPKHWHIKIGEVERKHSVFDSIRSVFGRVFGRDDWVLWNVHAQLIIEHPNYNQADNWKNDIVLIKLDKDMPIGPEDPNIDDIALPDSTSTTWPPEGSECVMKGWGCKADGGPLQDTAQHLVMPILASSVCDFKYGAISDSRICAGFNLENKGICKGDSGGPLVCKKDNVWMAAGIASFTSSQSAGDNPGVFTRVSPYKDWIQQVIAKYGA